MSATFKPDILGFACNWCGYAGADVAGLSKLEYPPAKFIRVNCLGTLDILTVLKAFREGYDGIILTGCHIGDCHYVSGNNHCHEQMARLKEMLDILGLDSRRLRVEEVSSAEGTKFARVVNEFWAEILALGPSPLAAGKKAKPAVAESAPAAALPVNENDLLCIQCGKCESFCPLNKVDPAFSPRRLQLQSKTSPAHELLKKKEIWKCLTCNTCGEVCAAKTKWVDYIRDLRQAAGPDDLEPECKHGNVLDTLFEIMANEALVQKRLQPFAGLKIAEQGEVMLFTGCSVYFNTIFDFADSTATVRGAVKIMNHLGLAPVILKDEKCCGYDSLFRGKKELFEDLRRQNIAAIERVRPKVIYTTCAECAYALRTYYLPEFKGWAPEIKHFSDYILKNIDKMKFKELARTVTFHDPCRLGRYCGDYSTVRDILKGVKGVTFNEMTNAKELATCCGVGNFVNCDSKTKFMQHQRLQSAAGRADTLVTACPKCKIHFKCYLDGKPLEEIKLNEIMDITELVTEAIDDGK